jgi:hypothetical protein
LIVTRLHLRKKYNPRKKRVLNVEDSTTITIGYCRSLGCYHNGIL